MHGDLFQSQPLFHSALSDLAADAGDGSPEFAVGALGLGWTGQALMIKPALMAAAMANPVIAGIAFVASDYQPSAELLAGQVGLLSLTHGTSPAAPAMATD
jgi:hypothetical protein